MSITPFDYLGNEVRVVEQDGEPWFVLADLCKVLGLARRPAAVAERLDDEVRQAYPIPDAMGREQETLIVSEAGMYDVVLRSDAPDAKPFRRWVTHEVIPAIRKHGGYLTPEATAKALADPDSMIRLLTALRDERAEKARLAAQAEADAPKVLFAEAVAVSSTTILVRELAKLLHQAGVNVGGNNLFEWLRRDGFLIKADAADYNMPTQKARDLGLFEIKETPVIHDSGFVAVSHTPRVTGKGQRYLIDYYLRKAA